MYARYVEMTFNVLRSPKPSNLVELTGKLPPVPIIKHVLGGSVFVGASLYF